MSNKKRDVKKKVRRRSRVKSRPQRWGLRDERVIGPSFQVESLEARILMSATWVDADGVPQAGPSEGADTFTGSDGADFVDALGGDDVLFGGFGSDQLLGGDGDDQLFGAEGDDILSGGDGNNLLDGGGGNDQVFGGSGNDTLIGGDGNDVLDGFTGDDVISGGAGGDVLISGGGNDQMDGGTGDDMFRFLGAEAGDTITVQGGEGFDTIDLSEYSADNVSDNGETITVDLGGGTFFTIDHTGVEQIVTGEAGGGDTVASLPDVTADDVIGLEDSGPIALDIETALTDTDGSETLGVRITGMPDGFDLTLAPEVGGDSVGEISLVSSEPITVTFTGEEAGFKNTFGYYVIDGDTGEMRSAEIVWDNASASGSGGSLIPGVSTENIDAGQGDTVGFFLISNGANTNNFGALGEGELEFRNTDGSAATLASQRPELWHIATDGTETKLAGNIFHSMGRGERVDLNADGTDHVRTFVDTENGTLALGFEDLMDSVSDHDFDDIVFTVRLGAENAANLDPIDTGDALVKNSDGTWTVRPDVVDRLQITPPQNFAGTVDLTVEAISTESAGGDTAMATQTFTVTVQPVNDGPVAGDDGVYLTNEDTPLVISDLLDNDTDIESDALAIIGVGAAEHGEVTLNGDGTITYTPDADYFGDDSFTYTISDGNGGTDTATVSLSVADVPDLAIGALDAAGNEDTAIALQITPQINITDAQNVTITISNVPSGALLSAGIDNGDGSWMLGVNDLDGLTVTPAADSNDDFDLHIQIDATSVTTNEVAGQVNTSNFNTAGQGFTVSARAIQPDGTLSDASSALVSVNGDGLGVLGDSSDQAPSNQLGHNPDHNVSEELIVDFDEPVTSATVQIKRLFVNEAASSGDETGHYQAFRNGVLVAEGDFAATSGSNLTLNVDIPDGETIDKLVFTAVPYNNSGDLRPDDSSDYFVKSIDFTAQQTIDTSELTAETDLHVTVNAVNDGPDAIDLSFNTNEDAPLTIDALALATDIDGDTLSINSITQPEHGSVTINTDGTLTYTPDADYNGADSFTYTISDGNGGTDTATVSLNVEAVNDGPEAPDLTLSTDEDTPIVIDALADVSDIDGAEPVIFSITQPEHGTVTVNPGGTLTYTPDADYNGADSFTYTVSDQRGGFDSATVSLNIEAVNDAPTAADMTVTTNEDVPVIVDTLASAADIDGDTLEIASVTQPEHGVVTINSDNTLTYLPDQDYNGSDSFTYTVSDGNGGTETATVSLSVTPVNDAPDAIDLSLSTNEDAPLTINSLASATDIDGDTLAIDSITQPEHGTVTINANGTLTYTPTANYNGPDSFTYTVSDGNGGTDTATVSLDVVPINDAPYADGGSDQTVDAAQIVQLNATGSSDADGDELTFTWRQISGPPVELINADTATPTFEAPITPDGAQIIFQVEVSDGQATRTNGVFIQVRPANLDTNAVEEFNEPADDEAAAIQPAPLEWDGTEELTLLSTGDGILDNSGGGIPQQEQPIESQQQVFDQSDLFSQIIEAPRYEPVELSIDMMGEERFDSVFVPAEQPVENIRANTAEPAGYSDPATQAVEPDGPQVAEDPQPEGQQRGGFMGALWGLARLYGGARQRGDE